MVHSGTWPNIPVLSNNYWPDGNDENSDLLGWKSNLRSTSTNISDLLGHESNNFSNILELAVQLSAIPEDKQQQQDTPRTGISDPLSWAEDRELEGISDNSSESSVALNPRFKTEFCRNFKEKGKCVFGDLCQFAHCEQEMRQVGTNTNYKTKRCRKYWMAGCCPYGPRCNFLHHESRGRVQSPMEPMRKASVARKASTGDSGCESSNSNNVSPTPYNSRGVGNKISPIPTLDTLHRPLHGSGRMAALVNGSSYTWIDTRTGIVVYK